MSNILSSIITTTEISMGQFALCTLASIVLGLSIAGFHSYRNRTSSGFLITIGLIPVIVQVIIMLVNGNLGAGVAVAGAFSLVRFRSAPGTAREIGSLFLAMAVGLATGMGYLMIAVLLVLIVGALTVILPMVFHDNSETRLLQIFVPEALDYEGAFEEILPQYTQSYELIGVKTAQMGTVYKLMYEVVMKKEVSAKQFLDELRVRNGNLEVSMGRCLGTRDDVGL